MENPNDNTPRTAAAEPPGQSTNSKKPRTSLQAEASRANGARSRGPVTESGKWRSARNHTRHGLLAATVVLPGESAERFYALLASFHREFQPETATEVGFVESMTVARWRLLRIWGMEQGGLAKEISTREHNGDNPATSAYEVLTATPQGVHRLARAADLADRQFDRNYRRLIEAQDRREKKKIPLD